MLRSVWVWLAVAATACAAPVWDGSSGSVRITQDPGAGKIAVRDSELSVTAENPQNVNKYLFFEIKCKPFSLKNKALSLEVRTAPESRGSSFYVFCYNAAGGCPAAAYSTGGMLTDAPRRIVIVPGRDGALKNYASKIDADTGKPVTRIVIATCRGPNTKLCIRLKNLETIPVPPPPVVLEPKDFGRTVAGGTSRGTIAVADGQGRDSLFVFLMDDINRRSLQIDAETGETTVVPVPFEKFGDAVYASVLSKKNRIYTHYNSHFLEYDPAQKKYTVCRKTFPQMAMFMTEAPDGVIWSATYPKCGVVSYDPANGKFTDYGSLNEENWAQYPRSIVAAEDGWIYIGIGSTRAQIVAFHPADGKVVKLLSGDAERPNPSSAFIRRYRDGNIYARVGAVWYKLFGGAKTRLDQAPNSQVAPIVAGEQGLFHGKFPSGKVIFARDLDLPGGTMIVRDPATGQQKTVKFQYDNPGVPMMALAMTETGIVGGGSFFPFRFATLDPATGRKTDQIARFQCNTIVPHGKYLYLGCYSGGQILRYDPARPWTWNGTMAAKEPSLDSNPAFYGKAHPDIHRPHGLAVSPDGKTVVMTGTPGYGLTGGGLAVLDTASGKMTVYSAKQMGWHPEASFSAAILPGNRALIGTTVDAGTGGERLAKHASLHLVDLAGGKVLRRSAALGNSVQTVRNLLSLADGTVLGVTDDQRLFRYDPARDRVLAENNFAEYGSAVGGQGPRILFADGGKIRMLFTAGVADVDPQTCRIVKMVLVKGGIGVGCIRSGMLYYSVGNSLKGVKLP